MPNQLDAFIQGECFAIDNLQTECAWVVWHYQRRGESTTEPPINPHSGDKTSDFDPTTWGTYAEACRRVQFDGLSGAGIFLTGTNQIVAIDLDDCMNKGELTKNWIRTYANFW